MSWSLAATEAASRHARQRISTRAGMRAIRQLSASVVDLCTELSRKVPSETTTRLSRRRPQAVGFWEAQPSLLRPDQAPHETEPD
jgi:hypothetical protein